MHLARRELTFETEDGRAIPVPVTMYEPEGSDTYWCCRYTIDWPDGTYHSRGCGVDQIQAILLTLQKIGTDIYVSDYHKTGRLYFERPGTGYGFPVPKNARELLVGDDKRFEG